MEENLVVREVGGCSQTSTNLDIHTHHTTAQERIDFGSNTMASRSKSMEHDETRSSTIRFFFNHRRIQDAKACAPLHFRRFYFSPLERMRESLFLLFLFCCLCAPHEALLSSECVLAGIRVVTTKVLCAEMCSRLNF